MSFGPHDEPAEGKERVYCFVAIAVLLLMALFEWLSGDPSWQFVLVPLVIAAFVVGRLLGWVNRGRPH